MLELTVIMPVYNGELFLEESIDSILNQTFFDFTLVIINDNSKDNTQEIIDRYIDLDKRISCLKIFDSGRPISHFDTFAIHIQSFHGCGWLAILAIWKTLNYLKHIQTGFLWFWFTFWKKKQVVKTIKLRTKVVFKPLRHCILRGVTESSLEIYDSWAMIVGIIHYTANWYKSKSHNIRILYFLAVIQPYKSDQTENWAFEFSKGQQLKISNFLNNPDLSYVLRFIQRNSKESIINRQAAIT